jgi:hypothetical protein
LNYYSELARVGPFDLPAGHRTRVSNLVAVTPKEDHPERDNRWMQGVLIEKPGRRNVRAFDFAYAKALTSEELKERLDVVNEFKARAKEQVDATPVVDPPSLDRKLRAEKRRAERTRKRLQEEAEKSIAEATEAAAHPPPDKMGPPSAPSQPKDSAAPAATP